MADDEDEVMVLSDLEKDDEAKEGADKTAQTQGAKPPPVPGPGSSAGGTTRPTVAAPDGLKDLERQIADERAARTRTHAENQRLARERDQAIAFAQEAERRGMSTYELYNENQITSLTEQMDALQTQQESAYNDGDFKTVAQINRKLADLGGKLANAERDKGALAENRARMETQHKQPRPRQPAESPPADPVERAIQNRTPATQQFLRKHPELIRSDGTLKRAAIDAHEAALDAGHSVDSGSYFEFIEGHLKPQGSTVAERPQPGRAPTLAAPVARAGGPNGGGAGGQPETVVVTPKMRRLAEEQGVPLKEWVVNYARLLKEGRITPIT